MAELGGKARRPQQGKAPAQAPTTQQQQSPQAPQTETGQGSGLGQQQQATPSSAAQDYPNLDAAAQETMGEGLFDGEASPEFLAENSGGSLWSRATEALGFGDDYSVEHMCDTDMTNEYRTKESASRELDRRGQGMTKTSSEGSGEHGREDANLTDELNHASWYGVAALAHALGFVNSARHMEHYLDNSGKPILDVPVDDMIAEVPKAREFYGIAKDRAEQEAFAHIAALGAEADQSFNLTGKQSGGPNPKSESKEWYFAVGSYDHWYVADVDYAANGDGTGTMSMTLTWAMKDYYNWDGGKSVEIGGIEVSDKQLGRLHVAGLAKEFQIAGTSTPELIEVEYEGDEADDGS